ncbi:hypothetical protein ONE63_005639 [Megalurothrips usitatus]|uniref:G-patch domain-containing protein n=1 Tax=Megalurothrips usitatus TaxID=439358 RepID=A0AAV7Y2F0_9NEOP|nr:hypothetical protein ONE63_005639 [Megalurothrips usitatus]
MSDPPKKFTFGFSKVAKKSNLIAPPPAPKERKDNVQFIECMEANSIKLKEGEEEIHVNAPLVIPIIGPRKSSTLSNGRSIAEAAEDFSDVVTEVTSVKTEAEINLPSDSLEALAAREILQGAADASKEKSESTLEALPKADSEEKEKLQKESTLEDYENIPVNQFGLAMLRGMGWKPDEGIGKNSKLIAVTAPQVRPKGMGLGADKMLLAAAADAAKTVKKKDEEELKLVKGAYVKVVAGMQKNQYAQVEGFSDDSGRIVLKMAIGGHVLSVNEATIILVSKSDYTQNSKVLNAAKYDDFKKKEEAGSSSLTIKKELSSPEERGRLKSPSSVRVSKKNEREKSWSPKPKEKKDRYLSKSRSRSPKRSRSRSPVRSDGKKKNRNKDYRDRSPSPYKQRSSSSSPVRNSRHTQPSSRRSRSRDGSPIRSKNSHFRKEYSDSDSDSQAQEKKKKKKKHKERRRNSSSSEEYSRSRSRSPKAKRKDKKSKRNASRSPSSRRRR